jgi:hypothetical protein
MNINLDDKKIVKIVYAVDDFTELNIEFKDGNICAVNKKYKNENSNYMNEIKDMLEKSRSSNWPSDIVKRRNEIEKKIEQDRENLEKTVNAKRTAKNSEIKNLYDCKKLIDMEKDGKLDEIVKEHREHGIPNQYATLFNTSCKDESDFDRLNEGLSALEYATNKNKEEEAVKKAIEDATESSTDKKYESDVKKDFMSTLDTIKENAEKYIDAKELEAKKHEEEITELIPNFEITRILMELVKMGYFEEIGKQSDEVEKSLFRARSIVDAINKVKTRKTKNND